MDEKKRRKNKKKNRSGPASSDSSSKAEDSRPHEWEPSINNISASPGDYRENSSTREEKQGVECTSKIENNSQKQGSNRENGFCHGVSEAVAKESVSREDLTNLLVEEACLRTELQAKEQAISKMREALDAECARSSQLHSDILELKTTHAASQASSQQHIHQLELEVGWLKEREANQKDVEVELKEKILSLSSEVMQLRAAKEKKEALMQEDVRQVRNDNAQLRGENVQLMEEVEKMKRHIDQLLLERRQLIAKMAALQTGMHQLEREAAIRARVGNELAEAVATTSSKGWLKWSSRKDSIAEAAAVAEDSRVQLAAAATMIKKLSAENAALVDKVNEQSALIDRLSSSDNHAMELHKDGSLMTIEGNKCEEMNSANHQMTVDPKPPELLDELPRGEAVTRLTLEEQSQIVKEEVLRSEPYETVANVVLANNNAADAVSAAFESSSNDSLAGDGLADTVVAVDLDRRSKIESSNEIVSVPPSQDEGLHDAKQGDDALVKQFEPKPFSDAPIMGAPIRLFTFVAKYVSGADLVNVKNSS